MVVLNYSTSELVLEYGAGLESMKNSISSLDDKDKSKSKDPVELMAEDQVSE